MSENPKPANDNPVPPVWNKEGLEEFRAAQGQRRLAADAKKLAKVFNEAAKSPALKEALDWAASHGVEFIVDRKIGAAGMYHAGTGILAVSEELFRPGNEGEAVVALAHEIRHAWQDYHRLLPNGADDYTGFYIRQTILEADAGAWGMLAGQEWIAAKRIEKLESMGRDSFMYQLDLDMIRKDTALVRWLAFKEWYDGEAPEGYGLMSATVTAQQMKLPVIKNGLEEVTELDRNMQEPEFRPSEKDEGRIPGIDIGSPADLAVLGRDFSGNGNYFAKDDEGFVSKKLLSRKLAQSFYQAGARPHPLVLSILKEETRLSAVEKAAQPPKAA